MENLKTVIETLYPMGATLMGAGYDNALTWLSHLVKMDILEFPTGQQLGTWTVPEEWVVKEAWVKFKGKKIIDYASEPLSLVVYSLPFKGVVSKEELMKHLHFSEENLDATPYVFKFYERDWGVCLPKSKVKTALPSSEGEYVEAELLEEGDYEVCIDTEFRPGKMKIGVHTIPGGEREILILAHLDHPYQANDNLSGVACALDLAQRLKCGHTVKIIFCPETIGSQAYALTQDLSRVDFVVSIDICGNAGDKGILFQKSWNDEERLNRISHCALQIAGKAYRKGKFRTSIGSDETAFNDPLIGIPGILLTTWPYDEYHTNLDTPDKIDYNQIKETADLVMKIIEIYEKDYIPVRQFKGPLMRSKYSLQSSHKRVNLVWDYLIYAMDGVKYLSELCADSEMNFDYVYGELEKLVSDNQIKKNVRTKTGDIHLMAREVRRPHPRQRSVKPSTTKK